MNLNALRKDRTRGFLDGHFLIAMPGMADANFARSVIYVCAHSDEGAMGFIINKSQGLSFGDMLAHLQVIDREEDVLAADSREIIIQLGGPVETGRGFVLHSDDYMSQSSIPVSEDISLTSTVDIVKAIYRGSGPRKAAMMMGYSGWRAGQLEMEIANNGWLNCPADEALIFDQHLDNKYERALAMMGINPAMLSREAGHA
jgi:putative transcriptional regulator